MKSVIFTYPVEAVLFEHETHANRGIDCGSCHPALFEMTAGSAEKKAAFTMASFSKGNYCGSCHDGDLAFAAEDHCTVCHIGAAGLKKRKVAK